MPGETLLKLNGEEIIDEIDYQALCNSRFLKIELLTPQGMPHSLSVHKRANDPLGLRLDERTVLEPRICKNHCVFCFVDQMPPHLRPTLYVKDDDWRLSLMMGNFVTLTNVDEKEFDRILRRKASPLYISVHATDPETRIRMLRNPQAGIILERLKRMASAGIRFHCQVVLCPGLNDGLILHQTIVDLAGLYPSAQSLAIVPIGLTDHRTRLYPLRLFKREEADHLLQDLELIQAYYLRTMGTRFVFPADEFYSIAGRPVPPEENYEGYPQLENGIGMLRLLSQECEEYWPVLQEELSSFPQRPSRHVLIPTGVSAFPYIQELVRKYGPPEDQIDVFPVPNHFFGPSVTVTGLITGGDLLQILADKKGDVVLISSSMLRENDPVFLDNYSVSDLETRTGMPFQIVQNHGESFLKALYQKCC